MKYVKGNFKYILWESLHVQLKWIRPKEPISWRWISLSSDGLLIMKEGYPSDGPSGPTIDTKDTLRGAFVHDALCQLMRQGLLDVEWEKVAADEADEIWDASGMAEWRTEIWEAMLDTFGSFAVDPKNKWEILEAP